MNFEGKVYSGYTSNAGYQQRTFKSEPKRLGFSASSRAKVATARKVMMPKQVRQGVGRKRDEDEYWAGGDNCPTDIKEVWKSEEGGSGSVGASQCRCPLCNRVFVTSVELKLHMTGEHRVNPLFCEICMKAFQSKNDYVGHMNSHMNLRPFACDRCGKTFSFKSSMIRHKAKVCQTEQSQVE